MGQVKRDRQIESDTERWEEGERDTEREVKRERGERERQTHIEN